MTRVPTREEIVSTNLPEDELNELLESLQEREDTWIDKHSVTCAVCGELADERECLPWYEEGEICHICQEKAGENLVECIVCGNYFITKKGDEEICPECPKVTSSLG